MHPNPGVPFSKIPEIPLSSGGKIPVLRFGTASNPPVKAETTKRAVLDAIEVGYRHFDTAALYYTEEPLGEAIAEAIEKGLIKSREELFITSKLWCSDAHEDCVLPALHKTLNPIFFLILPLFLCGNLKLEYIDLYLIHWPVSSKPGTFEYPIKKEDLLPMDYKSVWAAMEECQGLGLTKAIGVSNFFCKKLADVLATATIPPTVNQSRQISEPYIEFESSLPYHHAELGATLNATLNFDRSNGIPQAERNSCGSICCFGSVRNFLRHQQSYGIQYAKGNRKGQRKDSCSGAF
ncbi:hypothetical protein Vadar_006647 [Vaccinium darrowii]|uniref:Uncharacterized protein n=1 Tax=Vaccinium darrowii TaxID=229202 RepID=A0ACB7WYB5_9ERIC|nr:hypothetical protein Vadar_006647 [Vaccinium darrowii]